MARSVGELLKQGVDALHQAGVGTPRLDAEILLSEVTGLSRAQLISDSKLEPTEDQSIGFQQFIDRRSRREPVAYIVGKKHFRLLELIVNQHVLIPRPETEHLVEVALALPQGSRVVDVGTGSGAVALAVKYERPDLEVIATDISGGALRVARDNAKKYSLDIDFREGDLLEPVAGLAVDAVLSNPPYIGNPDRTTLAPEILNYEPASALFAGLDGFDAYRRLIPQVAKTAAAFVALEIGEGQGQVVTRILRDEGFFDVEHVKDLAGIDRVVVGKRSVA